MDTIGPLYCETYRDLAFIAEPINAITNIASLIAALLILIYLRRRNIKAWDLYTLVALLAFTGIGSFFWHAFRDPVALAFDALPGIMFFLLFLWVWATRLRNRWYGYGILLALAIFQFLQFYLFPTSSGLTAAFRVHGVFVIIALILVTSTYSLRGQVALWALGTVGAYSIAATARTIDLMVCSVVPFGTHFLWHIFLATGAYLGIIFLIKLRER